MCVANRIEMIRDHTDTHQWDYIGTKDNPADYSSRGINVANDKAVQKCNGFKDHLFCGNQKQRSGLFKFNTFQIFLFCLYIRKFVNSLLSYPQIKKSLQNFSHFFHYFYEFLTLNVMVKLLLSCLCEVCPHFQEI